MEKCTGVTEDRGRVVERKAGEKTKGLGATGWQLGVLGGRLWIQESGSSTVDVEQARGERNMSGGGAGWVENMRWGALVGCGCGFGARCTVGLQCRHDLRYLRWGTASFLFLL